MSKIYLYNPDNGSPIKKWFDGMNFWKLDIGEIAAFPENSGTRLKTTYGFLQVVSPDEFDAYLAKLDKQVISKVKVGVEGLEPKPADEVEAEEQVLEIKKKEAKAMKAKIKTAKDAEPDKLNYWEMNRGLLLNEIGRRGLEVKTAKGVYVSKEQLISLLENNDNTK